MELLFKSTQPVNFKDYCFIIPSISVGNVPQLTTDLIITTFNLKKIGSIWHSAIIPVVGSDPFDKTSADVCTACEIYCCETKKIAVLQLRSSLYSKQALSFFDALKQFVIKHSFKNVIILASGFSHEQHNINSGPFRYITNREEYSSIFKKLSILPMEELSSGRYLIHGSGFAVKLYEMLQSEIPCTTVVKYTSEGDNTSDAIQMIQLVNEQLEISKTTNSLNIKIPYSWNQLFGNPPPAGIY